MVAYNTGSDPIEIGNLWLKVKVTVTQLSIFLPKSLLISLLWISALLCLIKMKYGIPLILLNMPLVYSHSNFINIECEYTKGIFNNISGIPLILLNMPLVYSHSMFIKFECEYTKGIFNNISGIPYFILIRHKRAEIQSREINRDFGRKMDNCVTVTLTFNQRLPISIGSEPVL